MLSTRNGATTAHAQSRSARGTGADDAGLERERAAQIERTPAAHALDRLAMRIGRRLHGSDIFSGDDHLERAIEIGEREHRR